MPCLIASVLTSGFPSRVEEGEAVTFPLFFLSSFYLNKTQVKCIFAILNVNGAEEICTVQLAINPSKVPKDTWHPNHPPCHRGSKDYITQALQYVGNQGILTLPVI